MQDFPQSLLTLRDNFYTIIASILSGGAIVALVNWLASKRKTNAEVLEIHATAAKIEVEAREASTRTIMQAQARIVELVDINAELQAELAEVARQRDNHEYERGRLLFELNQLKIETSLDKEFIRQLKAANQLKIDLSELPPKTKVDT